MDDEIRLLSDPEKAGVVVVETEDIGEYQRPLLVEPVPLSSKFTGVSITSRPLPQANDAVDGKSKSPCFPKDTGWAAWRVLGGGILVQGILFAFPLTFGVFQDFFGREQKLSNATHSIWIGVLSTGLPFIGAPFMTALCETYPQVKWRYYVVVGWIICAASLIGAAFARSLLTLAITQGALYAVGLLLVDVPTLLILNTWFVKRRGTAYGLLFGITDLIGFGATILAEYLLRTHTLRGTLLSFGCGLLIICGPAMWLLRTRPADAPILVAKRLTEEEEEMTLTPLTRRATSNLCPPVTIRYYRRPIFYIFTLANLFHSFAYYLPFMYLPSYATDVGYSPTRGAYLLAAANFAQIFGEIGFGQLSDRVSVHWLIVMGSFVSSIAVLTLWGMAKSFAMLASFVLIFGSFGSGIISLWARMGTFFGQKDAQMIYSIMSFGRGVGSVASGPISSTLLAATGHRDRANDSSPSYGNGKYISVILFVGVSMAVSALMGIVGLLAGWNHNEFRHKAKSNLESRWATT